MKASRISYKHRDFISNPQNELLSMLGTGDTLVLSKLDRLARNTKKGIEVIEGLFAKKIRVYVLNVGLSENIITGRFFLTSLFAVTEI